jgi:hypothetical protein
MKRFVLFVLVFLPSVSFPFLLNAQDSYNIQGMVVDTSSDNSQIEYVYIGIIGKDVGTISNDSGIFYLKIPSQYINDIITFSRIGYYSKLMNIGDLINQKSIKISLVPKNTELEEVLVLAKGTKTRTGGNITRARGIVMAISSSTAGSEVGTIIRLSNEPVLIKNLNFHITANYPDSAKFRLNIYTFNKEIGDNILNENIYFTIPGKYIGDFKVDLSKYHLSLIHDILIAVETISVYSNGPDPNKNNDKFYDRIIISGTLTGSKSFYRKVSLGKWQKIKYSFSPGFWITYLN